MTFKFLKAQNGDCTIIKYIDNGGTNRNIIIDAGLDATYFDQTNNMFGELKAEVEDIKIKKENIDLLILTHIDNDHILGFLKLFEMDDEIPAFIKKVWFNSGKLIAEELKKKENKLLTISMQQAGVTNTGVKEGIEFEDFLLRFNFWERKLIFCGQEHEVHGAKFQILGPTIPQLKKLLKEYHEETGDDTYTGAGGNDWKTDLESFILEEKSKGFRFSQDNSLKNGSSISFILELQGRKFVFLGDAHPNPVTKALAKLGYNALTPLKVEFLKVSHHGSKANNNKKLLSAIDTEKYFISTNSVGHNHPHKRTLSRIISKNPNAIFHFNYENVWEGIFNESDRKKYKINAYVTPYINF